MRVTSHEAIMACRAAFEAGLILHAVDDDGAEYTAGSTVLPSGERGWGVYAYRRGPAEADEAFWGEPHLARSFVRNYVGKARAYEAARRALEKAFLA